MTFDKDKLDLLLSGRLDTALALIGEFRLKFGGLSEVIERDEIRSLRELNFVDEWNDALNHENLSSREVREGDKGR